VRWNQRYCQDPDCRRKLRRWQSARRQLRRRKTEEGRNRHREAEKMRRKKHKEDADFGRKPCRSIDLGEERGHAAKCFHENIFCARPGCFKEPRRSIRTTSKYCSDECRRAVRRVLDRERKWLARNRFAGRLKRRLEYDAARKNRRVRSP
jgi:hypothetical protein